eukprot:COSAG06_NODE_11912_length_1447_cov_0.666420_3_plen_61_part_00
MHAEAGVPVLPSEWLDSTMKGAEVVTLARELVLLCCTTTTTATATAAAAAAAASATASKL